MVPACRLAAFHNVSHAGAGGCVQDVVLLSAAQHCSDFCAARGVA